MSRLLKGLRCSSVTCIRLAVMRRIEFCSISILCLLMASGEFRVPLCTDRRCPFTASNKWQITGRKSFARVETKSRRWCLFLGFPKIFLKQVTRMWSAHIPGLSERNCLKVSLIISEHSSFPGLQWIWNLGSRERWAEGANTSCVY